MYNETMVTRLIDETEESHGEHHPDDENASNADADATHQHGMSLHKVLHFHIAIIMESVRRVGGVGHTSLHRGIVSRIDATTPRYFTALRGTVETIVLLVDCVTFVAIHFDSTTFEL